MKFTASDGEAASTRHDIALRVALELVVGQSKKL